MSTIAAIDPGIEGALLLVDSDSRVVLDAMPMPVIEIFSTRGKKKHVVDPAGVTAVLAGWRPDLVLIEQQGTRPQEGNVSAFTTGTHFGLLVGVCAGLALGYRLVQSTVWKAALGAPTGKLGSYLAVGRLDPAARQVIDARCSRKPHKIAGADAWGMIYAYLKAEQALAVVQARRRHTRAQPVQPVPAEDWFA